jgi:hypothetical protein
MVAELDAGIGPVKQRARGLTGGQLLVGMAAAQLAGQDCLAGMDRVRADGGSALLREAPVAPSTTAGTLAGRFGLAQLIGIETALAGIYRRWLARVPAAVRAPLRTRRSTWTPPTSRCTAGPSSRSAGPTPASRPAAPRLPQPAARQGHRPSAGGGVRRRDRRSPPLRPTRAAGLLGRAGPTPLRERPDRAPRAHQQGRQHAGPVGGDRGDPAAVRTAGPSRQCDILARRGKTARNIAKVAAAHRMLDVVFYVLRDGHARLLTTPASSSTAAA